jgi:hypothetical protein
LKLASIDKASIARKLDSIKINDIYSLDEKSRYDSNRVNSSLQHWDPLGKYSYKKKNEE